MLVGCAATLGVLAVVAARCDALRRQRRLAVRGSGAPQFYRTVDVHDDSGLELESNNAGRYRSPSEVSWEEENPFSDTPEKVR